MQTVAPFLGVPERSKDDLPLRAEAVFQACKDDPPKIAVAKTGCALLHDNRAVLNSNILHKAFPGRRLNSKNTLRNHQPVCLARLTKMTRTILLPFYTYIFFSVVHAQSRLCNNVRGYFDYNATKTAPITGLRLDVGSNGHPRIVPDNAQPWNLTARLDSTSQGSGTGSAVTDFFIDTGNTTTANMGLCVESAAITFNDFYLFSRKVLQRASEDKGDCKTMFGEQCVDALKRHFSRQAVEYARKGECPTAEYGFTSTAVQNQTVPWECSAYLDGEDKWNTDLLPGSTYWSLLTSICFDITCLTNSLSYQLFYESLLIIRQRETLLQIWLPSTTAQSAMSNFQESFPQPCI